MLLEGKVAIITGGAVGVGRATARMFADEGCSIMVTDIMDEVGQKTVDEVKQKGREGFFIHCDVTNNSQIQAMVKQTIDKFGKIDILVNNAGGLPGGDAPIEGLSEELWDRVVDLNLKSQFLTCKAVVPYMKARKYGKIINVSSMGAITPPSPVIHYHAAKAGVLGLTNNLAAELSPFNINVNAILPTAMRTEFFKDVVTKFPDQEAFFDSIAAHSFLKRMCSPEDIAGAALFFASELSAYITGESINVSGGSHLGRH